MGKQYRSLSDAWAELTGYVAQMVHEGSDDAAAILRFAHELKPGTRVFTGDVDGLIASREEKPGCN